MHILIKRNNARIEKWRAFLPKLEDNLKKKNIITKCINNILFFRFNYSKKKNQKRNT